MIVSAFAPVTDARATLTPQLRTDCGETELLLVDLGSGQCRLGGSALAQVHGQLGASAPDVNAERLKTFFHAVQALRQEGRILAYHDRSDGGLFATVCEMMFAGHCGVELDIGELVTAKSALEVLFNEELGAVLQVRRGDDAEAAHVAFTLGAVHCHRDRPGDRRQPAAHRFRRRASLRRAARGPAPRLVGDHLRICSGCAIIRSAPAQEYDRLLDDGDPGLHAALTYEPAEDVAAPYVSRGGRPRVAILREQGVNGQVEMAAAFDRAGFAAVDVHMTDIIAGRADLAGFQGLAAGGGFSYGDVLGAGEGWAKSILFNAARARRVRGVFPARRHLRAGRVQRLPDDEQPARAGARRARLAALRPEPLRAVRGALRDGRGAALAVALLRRAWPGAACRSWLPTARATPSSRTTAALQRRGAAGGAALRGQPRRA